MNSILVFLMVLFVSVLGSFSANAAIQESQVYFLSVASSSYQLGSGKKINATIQVSFFSKQDAEYASKNAPKVKAAIDSAMRESKIDVTTRKGKMILGAEVSAKLQEMGIFANAILWTSFLM